MIELLPDLLLACLLILTAIWCILLHRQLHRLRVERRDIDQFVAAIDAASQRAEAAIAGIRETAGEVQRTLTGQQSLARERATELARLVDDGALMARRLEAAIGESALRTIDPARSRERRGVDGTTPIMAMAAPVQDQLPAACGTPADEASRTRPRIDPELLKALDALR